MPLYACQLFGETARQFLTCGKTATIAGTVSVCLGKCCSMKFSNQDLTFRTAAKEGGLGQHISDISFDEMLLDAGEMAFGLTPCERSTSRELGLEGTKCILSVKMLPR